MSNNELKPTLLPCPFGCGETARFIGHSAVLHGVQCDICEAVIYPPAATEAEAAKAWNRRPSPPASPLKRYKFSYVMGGGSYSDIAPIGDYYLASDVDALLAARPESGMRGALLHDIQDAIDWGLLSKLDPTKDRNTEALIKLAEHMNARVALSAPGPDQTSAPQEAGAEQALRSLIKHCWVYSGYKDCARDQMTEAEKALFDSVVNEARHEAGEFAAAHPFVPDAAAPLVAPTPPLDWEAENALIANAPKEFKALGEHLTRLLDDDQWKGVEPLLIAALRSGSTAKGEGHGILPGQPGNELCAKCGRPRLGDVHVSAHRSCVFVPPSPSGATE